MPAPTLMHLARKACLKSYKRINNVGGLPYHLVRPFLAKVDNATQLHEIETNSPQIIGHVTELWRTIVHRDIPPTIRDVYDYEPADPSGWYTAYRKLKRHADKQAARDADALQQALAKNKSARDAQAVKVINPLSGPGLPGRGRTSRGPALAPGSRARVGKSILNDIRGGSRISKQNKTNQMWMKPSNSNHVRRTGQVTQAPVRMVQALTDSRSATNNATNRNGQASEVRPRPSRPQAESSDLSVVQKRRQAEERLKKIGLQSPQTQTSRPHPEHGAAQQESKTRPSQPANVFMTRKKKI